MTITVESCRNGATTLSRMNFSGYIRHVTTRVYMLNVHYCVLFSSRVRVMIRFCVCMVDWFLCTRICTTFDCHCHNAGHLCVDTDNSQAGCVESGSQRARDARLSKSGSIHQPRLHFQFLHRICRHRHESTVLASDRRSDC